MEKTILISFLLFRWADYDQNRSLFLCHVTSTIDVNLLRSITLLPKIICLLDLTDRNKDDPEPHYTEDFERNLAACY
jgi:hypothetical protein